MKQVAPKDGHHAPPEELVRDGLMAEERRMKILQIIRSEGRAKVNELVRRFNTSAVTIRSDHGGAVIQDTVFREFPVEERVKRYSKEKQRIGNMAATLVEEGETIILDSGTTTLEVARHLQTIANLQVLTNGLNIAVELLNARNIQTIIMGGQCS